MSDPLLSVRDLRKHYPITSGVLRREVGRVRAVDGIDFDLHRGETLGLIGETGCGKSTAATSLLRIEEPTGGSIEFDGEEVTEFGSRELKRFRRRTGMVFQNPTSSFDPRMSVGESIAEPLAIHGMSDRERRRRLARDLLERVGLEPADVDRYPHELSGGQKQRAALARALALNPDLLIADEPVSALDVSVQAEILSLLSDLQEELDLSVLLITHDMGVVREVTDRIAVMYLGEIVEIGPTEGIFRDPEHPYTRALVASVPKPDPRARGREVNLTGEVPDPSDPPSGCRFHTRCPAVIEPEGYEFDREAWRAAMDLRVDVRDGRIDLESLYAGEIDAGEATAEERERAIREEYGLPEELGGPDAEEVLSAALSALAEGDVEAADERLSAEFETVCERRRPEPVAIEDGHLAACHLHDPEVEARR